MKILGKELGFSAGAIMFLATELLLQPLNPHFNGMCSMQRLLRVCPGHLTTGSGSNPPLPGCEAFVSPTACHVLGINNHIGSKRGNILA